MTVNLDVRTHEPTSGKQARYTLHTHLSSLFSLNKGVIALTDSGGGGIVPRWFFVHWLVDRR